MSFRRFGVLALFPCAIYAYACSSSDSTTTTTPDNDAGTRADTGGPIVTDPDSGNTDPDAALPDDAGPTVTGCIGNPLADEDAGTEIAPGALATVATGHFLSGPRWIGDAIVYSEVTSQTIVRNAAAGGARIALRKTGDMHRLPIGNGRTGDFLYTAVSREPEADGGAGGEVLKMLLDGGDPTSITVPAFSPNQLVASKKGFVYFTDPNFQGMGNTTGIYRLGPDGVTSVIASFDGGVSQRAYGVALSKDESSLYVGFFEEKSITKFALDADGVASNPTKVAVTIAQKPTGIALDQADNLWVAESPDAPGGLVEVFSPTGSLWGTIPFADARPTGVAFGGPDGTTVFITTERGENTDGTLYSLTSRCSGLP